MAARLKTSDDEKEIITKFLLDHKGLTKSQKWVENEIKKAVIGVSPYHYLPQPTARDCLYVRQRQEICVARNMAKHLVNLHRKYNVLHDRMVGIFFTLVGMGDPKRAEAFDRRLEEIVDTHMLEVFNKTHSHSDEMLYTVEFRNQRNLMEYKNAEMEKLLQGLKLSPEEKKHIYTLHPNPSPAKPTIESLRADRGDLRFSIDSVHEELNTAANSDDFLTILELVSPRSITAFEKTVIKEAFRQDALPSSGEKKSDLLWEALDALTEGKLVIYEDKVAVSKKAPPPMPFIVRDLWFPIVIDDACYEDSHRSWI